MNNEFRFEPDKYKSPKFHRVDFTSNCYLVADPEFATNSIIADMKTGWLLGIFVCVIQGTISVTDIPTVKLLKTFTDLFEIEFFTCLLCTTGTY